MTTEDINELELDFPHISGVVMASERLIFNTTEDILLAMQDSGVSQTDLAKKMGKSKSYISQILDGSRNLTLKTLSDITYALGAEVRLSIFKDGRDVSHQIVPEKTQYVSLLSDLKPSMDQMIRVVITPTNMDFTQNVAC